MQRRVWFRQARELLARYWILFGGIIAIVSGITLVPAYPWFGYPLIILGVLGVLAEIVLGVVGIRERRSETRAERQNDGALQRLGLSANEVSHMREAQRGTIRVLPKRLTFEGTDWQEVYALTLETLSDRPVYSVTLCIWSDDIPDLPLEVDYGIGDKPIGPVVQVAGQVRADMGRAFGRGHVGGRGFVLLYVGKVDPGQPVRTRLVGRPDSHTDVFAEILDYSEEQHLPEYVKPHKGDGVEGAAVPIYLRAGMTMTDLGFFIVGGPEL